MTDLLETIRWTAQEILPLKQSEWLSDAMDMLREDFRQIGEIFPDEIHIIVDYPSTKVSYSWMSQYQETFTMLERGNLSLKSEMTQYHIFVNPTVDGLLSLDILVHELVHAVAGAGAGHGERFQEVATAIGLNDALGSAAAEEVLLRRLRDIQEILGAYPLVTNYLEKALEKV